jgi:aminoglycoside phosphotransferase family enzyme
MVRTLQRPDGMQVALADKVAFLATEGRLDTVVETVETHLSWVFLTARRVYKLKKPVALPYVDHRALARRRSSCDKELALGRRLAADVYLDVVPMVWTPRGLALGGDGEVVEWLVAMRRLAETAMLPHALAAGTATMRDADAFGEVLARFYAGAAASAWSGDEYVRRMRGLVVAYADELVERGEPRPRIESIAARLLARCERCAARLAHRIAEGRVVDAHGDLRPEHVCLEATPVAIDPLEFDDDLRTLDAASELAFFTLECERLGAAWFAGRVVARYAAITGDAAPHELVALYRGQHALARGLIAVRRLADAPPAALPGWRAKADDYLAHAHRAA